MVAYYGWCKTTQTLQKSTQGLSFFITRVNYYNYKYKYQVPHFIIFQ